jgi:DnaJ-class molecular chaperone
MQPATTSSGTDLEPVGISRPSRLELSGSDEGVLINLILEQVCVFCGGGGFTPVTGGETCSSCSASGYELVDNEKLPCSVCDGTCWVSIEEMEECERCDGTGLELTGAGRRLLCGSGSELPVFLNRWRDWGGRV